MNRLSLLPALLALGCLPAIAQQEAPPQQETPDQQEVPTLDAQPEENVTEIFSEADQDGNGLLSFEEARAYFPNLNIQDGNGDGWLNHNEVQSALPNFQLGFEDAGSYTVVGEAAFLEIVRTVEDDDSIGLR